jgi:hypothetical protein
VIWKDGVWRPSGVCDVCDEVGPLGFHCKRCALLGYLYVGPELTLDEVVADPRELGSIANHVHQGLSWPNPIPRRRDPISCSCCPVCGLMLFLTILGINLGRQTS